MRNSSYIGLQGAAKSWLTAKLRLTSPLKKFLIVCDNRSSAEEVAEDLKFFAGAEAVSSFLPWDSLPFEAVSPQTPIAAQRIKELLRIKRQDHWICITSIDALTQKLLPPELLMALCFELCIDQPWTTESLAQALTRVGFIQVSLTEEVGHFSVRGSVVDFYSSDQEQPTRVEILNGKISRISSFAADSQRSLETLTEVSISPVRECLPFFDPGTLPISLAEALAKLKARGRELEVPPREIALAMSALRTSAILPGLELLHAIAAPRLATFFEFLPQDTQLVIFDKLKVRHALDRFKEMLEERQSRFIAEHALIPNPSNFYLDPEELIGFLDQYPQINLDALEVQSSAHQDSTAIPLRSIGNTELTAQLKTKVGTGRAWTPLRLFIEAHRSRGERICFVIGSETRRERLKGILLDLGVDAKIIGMTGTEWATKSERYPVAIAAGSISEGSQIISEKLIFIAENELFPERSHRRGTKTKKSLRQIMSTLAQLREGDFIVHQDYGIGIYRGLSHISVEQKISDFLQIEYSDSTLYLPVQLISKVQKFSAAEGQAPTLDRLGSNRWAKTKLKVRQSVVVLAGDLIKLYAERSVAKGWRFDVPGSEDERFADGFPFDETPDQLAAIQDVLNDMAAEKPMDRLVCGDVGFGKTEVAVRAAYKCTQHARQVAVLVPTTVLVEQHRKTFENRFSDYPVKIGAVSRFYSSEQNKETLAKVSSGELDIVIGTHRLLSKDVHFKDLGLCIIDEEHRFGVKQKETLKQLKKQVDVLTLTATPIPRTLHMSLLEIRDISLISTAPHNRVVTRTYVAHQEDSLVRDAIIRELQRGGQCFFVHNRIESIDGVTAGLAQLVPEARFAFAHGQMSEGQLEKIMKRFLDKEIDVLVSTTIIESGLDIPNANTIIVDRSDTYGLAQLYQLRGRVGRSNRQAYAYFMIPKTRKLGLEAQQRLKVLQSLDDLGVGFNLAVRDLEIRGAGNLLGKEQSGSVLSVGYDLYTKILREAVLHLKGEEPDLAETIDPEVKLPIEAYIPEHYIPDISERLVMYQRLAAISGREEALDLSSEIEDRFGPIGRETENLIALMTCRAIIRNFGVVKLECSGKRLALSFSPRAPIDGDAVFALIAESQGRFKFSKSHTLTTEIEPELATNPAELLGFIEPLLRRIYKNQSPVTELERRAQKT